MFRSLALALLVFLGLARSEQNPDRILDRAIQLHQSGNIQGAIREYRAYLKLRPNAFEARSNLGAALAHDGLYNEAIVEYRLALGEQPDNPGVLLNLALAYYKSGRFSEAAHQLAQVRTRQPENRQALLIEADCHLRLGENKQVIDLLSPLEKGNQTDLAVTYLLGTALIRDKQPERGQVLIDRILRNGDSAEARLLMGTTKSMVGDYAGALAELKRAVELNPKLPDVYSYYGMALLHTGDTSGAADAFRKELASNPNDFTANLELGALERQDQDYDPAVAHLKHALDLRPGDPGARYQIAAANFSLGKVDEARVELEKLIAESPQFTEAHVTLATVYYRLKRKADGDRERAIVKKLEAERQAKQPGAAAQRSETAAPK
ncbi:MAG TPA: tetratricopeptide repeat protein [Bryobacteraceae bacterium]|nr:tetratricopeptide repeat protein [Bryobacteraceae bacterium]